MKVKGSGNMKKNLVLVLAVLVVCAGLVSCGQDKEDNKKNKWGK